MANIFNAAEVIDMGIEKEKRRRDYYALVAESFKEKEMKDLFAKLRDWESLHIKKFTDIRNSLDQSEVEESYEGELAHYIRSLIDDMYYNEVSPAQFSENVATPLEAIRYGMIFEKDAILFFNELLGYMEPVHREKVTELLNEEKEHLIFLSELKRKYEKI